MTSSSQQFLSFYDLIVTEVMLRFATVDAIAFIKIGELCACIDKCTLSRIITAHPTLCRRWKQNCMFCMLSLLSVYEMSMNYTESTYRVDSLQRSQCCNTSLQGQKAVTAYLKSEKLLPFSFVMQFIQ